MMPWLKHAFVKLLKIRLTSLLVAAIELESVTTTAILTRMILLLVLWLMCNGTKSMGVGTGGATGARAPPVQMAMDR